MTARLRRAAQRVIEEADRAWGTIIVDAGFAQAINALEDAMPRTKRRPPKPSKVERETKKRVRWGSDAAVRERVLKRDGFKCCICSETEGLELDHFLGRGRDRRDAASWTLCHRCHVNKTENRPSRKWWLGWFKIHVAPISAEMVCRVDALLALDAGKRRALAPPSPDDAKETT